MLSLHFSGPGSIHGQAIQRGQNDNNNNNNDNSLVIVYSVSSYRLNIVFPGLICKFSYFSLFYCPSLFPTLSEFFQPLYWTFFFSYHIFNIQKLFLTVCSFLKSNILFFFQHFTLWKQQDDVEGIFCSQYCLLFPLSSFFLCLLHVEGLLPKTNYLLTAYHP